MSITINPDRLKQVTVLKDGGHTAQHEGPPNACLLEAVAYVAGEEWSDHPECVCPTLGAFGRAFNDGLPDDAARTRILAPFVPRLVGTARPDDPEVAERRSYMALDWLIRTQTPAWLHLAGLDAEAKSLEDLDPITSLGAAEAAGPLVRAAKAKADAARAAARAAAGDAARAAAWAAAGDAARDAAWAAAGDAARAAAWAAAWAAARAAARAAAWAAARDAAGDAAWAAAGDAARAALAPTVTELQASAADLFDRMILVAPGPDLGDLSTEVERWLAAVAA